jgi:hypothetical protein
MEKETIKLKSAATAIITNTSSEMPTITRVLPVASFPTPQNGWMIHFIAEMPHNESLKIRA